MRLPGGPWGNLHSVPPRLMAPIGAHGTETERPTASTGAHRRTAWHAHGALLNAFDGHSAHLLGLMSGGHGLILAPFVLLDDDAGFDPFDSDVLVADSLRAGPSPSPFASFLRSLAGRWWSGGTDAGALDDDDFDTGDLTLTDDGPSPRVCDPCVTLIDRRLPPRVPGILGLRSHFWVPCVRPLCWRLAFCPGIVGLVFCCPGPWALGPWAFVLSCLCPCSPMPLGIHLDLHHFNCFFRWLQCTGYLSLWLDSLALHGQGMHHTAPQLQCWCICPLSYNIRVRPPVAGPSWPLTRGVPGTLEAPDLYSPHAVPALSGEDDGRETNRRGCGC